MNMILKTSTWYKSMYSINNLLSKITNILRLLKG